MHAKEFAYIVTVLAFSLSISIEAAMAESPSKKPQPGKVWVEKLSCSQCHIINGEGSVLAPPLDGIGRYRDLSYILKRLSPAKDSAQSDYALPAEIMSHVHVPANVAKPIAQYLLSLPERKISVEGHGNLKEVAPGGSQFEPLAKSASSERGVRTYIRRGCMSCHSVGSVGGHIGPDLAGVGARRGRKYIEGKIAKGATLLPKPGEPSGRYSMPPSGLRQNEIQDLTNWLLTLPPRNHRT